VDIAKKAGTVENAFTHFLEPIKAKLGSGKKMSFWTAV
jgi:hypothetical protein